jgi:hypothetical protein
MKVSIIRVYATNSSIKINGLYQRAINSGKAAKLTCKYNYIEF